MNGAAFYQHLYETELQSREHLQSALSTPLSVLVLAGTGLVLLAEKFKADHLALHVIFWMAFAGALAAFLMTVYMLVCSFHGYVYHRIPFPSQLIAYHENLKKHYAAQGLPGLADQEFELYLKQRYIEAGSRNAVHNANRVNYLLRANRALIICLCALMACTVPYVVAMRLAPESRVAGTSRQDESR
jgi:hypothetical protein